MHMVYGSLLQSNSHQILLHGAPGYSIRMNKSYPPFTNQKRQRLENVHAAVHAVSINIKGLALRAHSARKPQYPLDRLK